MEPYGSPYVIPNHIIVSALFSSWVLRSSREGGSCPRDPQNLFQLLHSLHATGVRTHAPEHRFFPNSSVEKLHATCSTWTKAGPTIAISAFAECCGRWRGLRIEQRQKLGMILGCVVM